MIQFMDVQMSGKYNENKINEQIEGTGAIQSLESVQIDTEKERLLCAL